MYLVRLVFVSLEINLALCQLHFLQSINLFDHKALRSVQKCYDDLGCVVLTSNWTDEKYRPVNVLPIDRCAVNTIFIQWRMDEKNTIIPDIINPSHLRGLHVDNIYRILIHDFTSNGYAPWIKHLSRCILRNRDTRGDNIISVNWAAGAEPPYIIAVANARLVALEIVNFLEKLKASEYYSKKVQLVGHGLGSHIAGYVGKMVYLDKITAFDPSGPYFEGMPPMVRLHKDDAQLVEVIHSHTGGQGYKKPIGHIDLYPNGGKKQPGCSDSYIKYTAIKRDDLLVGESLSGCSHKRGLKYYIESVMNPNCKFIGIACNSYIDFMKGKCSDCNIANTSCVLLHPESIPNMKNESKQYYFITSDSSPFCGEMLKIFLSLRPRSYKKGNLLSTLRGFFNLSIVQGESNISVLLNENHRLNNLGKKTNNFIVFRSTPPVLNFPLRKLYLKWTYKFNSRLWTGPPVLNKLYIGKINSEKESVGQWFCPGMGSVENARGMSLEPCIDDMVLLTF